MEANMQSVNHEIINVCNVRVPIVKSEEKLFYPVTFTGSRLLLKSLNAAQLSENGYGEYIQEFIVNVPEFSMYHQQLYFIEQEGLIKVLQNCRIARLSMEQRMAMDKVCKYLGINININFLNQEIDKYEEWKIQNTYSYWDKECIKIFVENNSQFSWQICSECTKYYPKDFLFFKKQGNPKNKKDIQTKCKCCLGSNRGVSYYGDELLYNTYFEDGQEWYEFIKDNRYDYCKIYLHYYNNADSLNYPRILKSVDVVSKLIVKCYGKDMLENSEDCEVDYISQLTKVPSMYIVPKYIDIEILNQLKPNDIIKNSSGLSRLVNSKFKKSTKLIKDMSEGDALNILKEHISNHQINIEDPYNFNYDELLKECGIQYAPCVQKDKLGFIMKLYDNHCFAYKFNTLIGKVYWKNESNRKLALKHLIEEDMKIKKEKIPLYLTLERIRQHSGTMRNVLRKYYDNNLWACVNEIYPKMFEEQDFNIGVIRNIFDSAEEHAVHDILKERFKNVIYNQRRTQNTVELCGMQPDWFIFSDKGVWIIEYFGIACDQRVYNQRVADYVQKTKRKIDTYENKTEGYNTIYLYPEDLKNNFKGLIEKVSEINT